LPLFGKRQQISAETLEAILCGKVKPLLLSASQQQNPEREMLKKKVEGKCQQSSKVGGDLPTGFKMEII